ncbi:coiled-coil-helix-coiled-coil-helix domain-containing protein 10, mitochondrial-like [Drosophila nasuta]|uniref:coiled-coil-helix-coiled-coil-helix domain-containing protein 10, mitochondrial-like n=1 Tax=Drosophila nasuta TaxID=42062 RepID=UPI00295E7544|nr:coiled-coil-helix-coiled-coil-helix domain-containing protein 10, mitochondrial-like [Drosophila nasuta]
MPRQRSSKPTSAAGRQSTRSSSTNNSRTPFTRKSSSNLPTVQPKAETKPATVPAPAAPSSGRSTGDLMKDMAATAAGVAVGSAVGHAVGAGITGAFSGSGGQAAAQQAPQQTAQADERKPRSELVEEGPCAYEIRQFLKCSEENSDLSVCQGFNEALRQCRQRYNL